MPRLTIRQIPAPSSPTRLRLFNVLALASLTCRRVEAPAVAADSRPESPLAAALDTPDSVADMRHYGTALDAQLRALRRAASAGVRLSAFELDSIGATASSLAPPVFRRLEHDLSSTLQHHAWPPGSNAPLDRLDSLRAEVLVWRVRAGP